METSRHTKATLEQGFQIGKWQVRARACELVSPWPSRAVEHVEPKAMQVLLALAGNQGQFLSKDQLLEAVWGSRPVTDDCLTGAIHNLRQALGDSPRDPDYIETRHNVGYRLVAPVRQHNSRKRTLISAAALVLVSALTALGLVFYHDPASSDQQEETIAVLPFANLSQDPQQEYLAAVLSDALILNLAQWQQFRVTSRTSVMPYADSDFSAREVAERLGVDLLVEGSVLASDGRVRVSARLVDPFNERHLWTQQFDRAFDDVLDLQSEISALIAHQIGGVVSEQPGERLQLPAEDMKKYLQARYELAQGTGEGVRSALEGFEALTQARREFGLAYLGKAQALLALFRRDPGGLYMGADILDGAFQAAQRAEALAVSGSELHRCAGQIVLYRSWDFPAAESHFVRALALSPSDTVALRRYAWLLVAQQRYEEAESQISQLRLLDPLYFESAEMAQLLLYSGRTDQAILEFERLDGTIELGPAILRLMAVAYVQQGRETDARNALQRLLEASVELSVADRQQLTGQNSVELYREILDRGGYRSPVAAASYQSLVGESDAALASLEKALAQRDPNILFIGAMPEFSMLESDARYQQLLAEIGISPVRSAKLSNPH